MKYIHRFKSHDIHEAKKPSLGNLEICLTYCEQEGLTFLHPSSLKKLGVGDYLLKNKTIVKTLDNVDVNDIIAIKVIPENFLPDNKARFIAIKDGTNGAIDLGIQWLSSSSSSTLSNFNKVPCADPDTVNINKSLILNNYKVQGWHDWGRTAMEISNKNTSLNPHWWQNKVSDVTDSFTHSTSGGYVYGPVKYNNLNEWYIYTDPLDDNGVNENKHTGGSAPIPSPYIYDFDTDSYIFNGAYYATKDEYGRPGANMLADIDGISNTAELVKAKSKAALYCNNYTLDGAADWYAKGKWYLPAIGELCFILSGWATIQDSILNIKNYAGSAVTFNTDSGYWSSTQYSASSACLISTSNGSISSHNKTYPFRVRPFLQLN